MAIPPSLLEINGNTIWLRLPSSRNLINFVRGRSWLDYVDELPGQLFNLRLVVQAGCMEEAIACLRPELERRGLRRLVDQLGSHEPRRAGGEEFITAEQIDRMRRSRQEESFANQYDLEFGQRSPELSVTLRMNPESLRRLSQELEGFRAAVNEELPRVAEQIADHVDAIAHAFMFGQRQWGMSASLAEARSRLSVSGRACSNCDYFMKGYKRGEPNICNAFHAVGANIHAPTECADWC
jgi:hypothetical protein